VLHRGPAALVVSGGSHRVFPHRCPGPPEMHRVHHSVIRRETHSNFGFNVPCWDRIFGTYRAQPEAGHESMTIGLSQFRGPGELRLSRMLMQPLQDAPVPDAKSPREPM